MTFKVFDREQAPHEAVVDEPLVRIDDHGRMVFNQQAWAFLAMQVRPGTSGEVVLLFDEQTRTVGVQPAGLGIGTPAGTRWPAMQMRSHVWPRAVPAREFITHYQVAAGEYRAQLMRSPGPRMVTFQVATLQVVPQVVPIADDGGQALR